MTVGFSWLIYGDIRVGKTWLAATAPGPRLYLDVENRSDTLPGKVVRWDGKGAFPDVDEDTTVVVPCKRVSSLNSILTWVKAGKLNKIKSIIIDSVTLLQQNEIDETFNGDMSRKSWGELLKLMSPPMRSLLLHLKDDKTALECVVITAWLRDDVINEQLFMRPEIDGKLRKRLAHLTDAVGYLYVKGTGATKSRVLQIEPTNGVTAGVSYPTLDKYNGYVTEPNISKLNTEIRP